METRKRRWTIGGMIGLLILILGAGTLVLTARGTIRGDIAFVHALGDENVVEALRREIGEYSSLYPSVTISFRPGSPDTEGDVVFLPVFPAWIEDWLDPPVPWSGRLWVLAARRDILDELARKEPDAVGALRSGKLDAAGFEELLAIAATRGTAPIALGNSHRWPWLLWAQSWTAATLGAEAALRFPSAATGGFGHLAAVREGLGRWRRAGWIDEASWKTDWAQGLVALESGASVFAIISQTQLSSLGPATRASLEYLPFPHRQDEPSWSLGSAQYLAIRADTRAAAAARELLRFLTSPGVTARLAAATGRPFFSWSADGRAPSAFGAWIEKVNTPELDELAAWFEDKAAGD